MPAGDRLLDDLLLRCTFPPAGSAVTCAFSGGADSSALLVLALHAGCQVTAIHVDHRLRPESADGGRSRRTHRRHNLTLHSNAGRFTSSPAATSKHAPAPHDRQPCRRTCSPATRPTTRPKRCSSTCCAGPGPAGSPRCNRDRRSRCSPSGTPRPSRCAASVGIEPVVDPSNAEHRFVRNRLRHEALPLLGDIARRDVDPLIRAYGHVAPRRRSTARRPRRGTRPARRPGDRRRGSGAGSTSAALVDRGGRLPAGSGHPRPDARRGPRRSEGLRPGRWSTPGTAPATSADRARRLPSNLADGAVTSSDGMGSPFDEVGTLVVSPAR